MQDIISRLMTITSSYSRNMFVISDSDFPCDWSEGTWIWLLPVPARWKSESVNTIKLRCVVDYTVMLLKADIFVISVLSNFVFYMLDLRQCKRLLFFRERATSEVLGWHRGINIWIRIRLFCNFLYDTGRERRWSHRIRQVVYIINEWLWDAGFDCLMIRYTCKSTSVI